MRGSNLVSVETTNATSIRLISLLSVRLGSFDTLRTIFSAGAVLTAPMFEWVQQAFGSRIHIASGTGGTDICGGCEFITYYTFCQSNALGSSFCSSIASYICWRLASSLIFCDDADLNPRPELQAKSLGMAVEIFDTDGKNIEDTGVPGELVVTRPHPSLPAGFWGDECDKKYKEAYFEMYPGTSSATGSCSPSYQMHRWQVYGVRAISSSRTPRPKVL